MAESKTKKRQAGSEGGGGGRRRKKTSGQTRSTAKNTGTKAKAVPDKPQDKGIPMSNEIQLIVAIGIMIILMLSNFGLCGYMGKALSSFFFGVFGCVQYIMPAAFCLGVFLLIANDYSTLSIKKCSAGFAALILISAFAQVIYQDSSVRGSELFSLAVEDHRTGGVLGGGIGLILKNGFGTAGALVILSCMMLLALIMLTQRSFVGFFQTNVSRGSRLMGEARQNHTLTRQQHMEERDRWQAEQDRAGARKRMPLSPDHLDRVRQVEEKLKQIQESRSRKQKTSAQAARERLMNEPDLHRDVPVFTSSEEIKSKDEMTELHPTIYPVTAEDNRTKPFEGELDFTAFSFNSGKSPEEFVEDISRNSKDLKMYLDSLEVYVPPYRTKGGAVLSELTVGGGSYVQETAASPEPEIHIPEPRQPSPKPEIHIPEPEQPSPEPEIHISGLESSISEQDEPITGPEPALPEPDKGTSGQSSSGKAPASGSDRKADAESIKINRAPAPAPVRERKAAKGDDYVFPPMNLLTSEEHSYSAAYDQELKETALKLQTTLESFGVRVTITDISCGPAVTRYEMFPEQGTKVSKIVSLTDDIKLNLAAADIRIEAPIPGKAAVGIEVPNKETMTVHLRDLIDNRLFRNFKSKLAFAVGKDIGGKIVVTDLAKMPHLLIAGATGSGKSVCINTLILSLLYKARPEEVKLIMIDPKMVELSVYNGIPHLLIPVVTDPKKASGALNWAVAEMTDRYKKFAESNVRNIEGYNKKVESLTAPGEPGEGKLEKMPQIVIIIDELADLMMVAPGEVEDAIVRLSQLARAAGIHLVIATQRPSVNVITGLIKANVPSRIAFSVSSGVDSRTIIDMNGAEKLLGKGDMLFYPSGYQKPVRVQGALVGDAEVASVVEFIKQNEEVVYDDQVSESIVNSTSANSSVQDRDEYFEAAARFILEKDKATIGMLQRMFKIGFNRAARIMDQLADAGIVGPEEGTKPRQILMSQEQLDQYLEEY